MCFSDGNFTCSDHFQLISCTSCYSLVAVEFVLWAAGTFVCAPVAVMKQLRESKIYFADACFLL